MEKTSQNDSSVLSSTPVKALNAGNLVSLKMNEKSSITEIIDVCQSIVQILKLKPSKKMFFCRVSMILNIHFFFFFNFSNDNSPLLDSSCDVPLSLSLQF